MRQTLFLFFLLALLPLLSACRPSPKLYSQTTYVFGTKVDITIADLPEDIAKKHITFLFRDFDRMHERLHAWEKSDLNTINQGFSKGQTMPIDPEFKAWLQNAQILAQCSDHLFNPAAGQLIATWGFHQDTYIGHLPSLESINAWKKNPSQMNQLVFTDKTVKSLNPHLSLDMGGIAKGWALDRASAYLRHHKICCALINVGGNILALGTKNGSPWTIGLQDPRAPEPMASLTLQDGEAIGTSGDYQRYFFYDNQRYSHLLDPRIGQPAQGIMSSTVITAKSKNAGTLSDVATKPLFINGVGTAPYYLQKLGIEDALIITTDNIAYLTPSMAKRLQWLRKPKKIFLFDEVKPQSTL